MHPISELVDALAALIAAIAQLILALRRPP